MSYPDIEDDDFYNKIYGKKEFNENTSKIIGIKQEPYQQFVRKYINKGTPYDSLFLFWALGSGKGLGSISITENFKGLISQNNGLEKFLIITKSKTLQNVYRRELAKYYYASDREQQLVSSGNRDAIKEVKKRINNYYEFINYDELSNRIIGQSKKSDITEVKRRDIKSEKAITNFSNRIVVIDEIQNITGNYRFLSIFRALQNSKNIKLIILSATPITNSVDEMIYISNLLNWKNPPFKIDENELELTQDSNIQLEKVLKHLYKEKILELSTIDISNEKEQLEKKEKIVSRFTDSGEQLLLASLKGKISYQSLDPVNFPSKIRIGEPITDRTGSLKVVKCNMSSYQEEAYLYARNTNKGSFYGNLSEISTIAYNGSNLEEATDSKNLRNTPLDLNNLYKYSTKLFNIIKNIKKSSGIVFIYSNSVQNGGTKLIANVLEKNGYVHYSDKSKDDREKFILYSDTLTEKERSEYQRIINDVDNLQGKKVKIIIGSPLIAEGLSFFNVRQIHILDPHWNLSRILQAEGRCIRNYSHELLSPKERNVSIYWYISVLSNGEETVDQIKYLICEEKDRAIKSMERKLKRIAIDCYNYKQISNNKKLNNIEAYKDYYQDYSQECDYEKCDYECMYIDEEKIKKYRDNDLSLTYDTNTDPYQIDASKQLIKKLFISNNIYNLEIIEDALSDTGINSYNIYWALNELVSKKEKFIIPKKGFGYIIYTKKYYRFIPIKLDIKEKKKNISDFLAIEYSEGSSSSNMKVSSSSEDIKVSSSSEDIKSKSKIKESVDDIYENPVINKISLISDFIDNKNETILGIIERGEFKIADLSKNKDQGTNRDAVRGRQALTYNKTELKNFIARLNLTDKNGSKSDYCEMIKKELKKRKMIMILE